MGCGASSQPVEDPPTTSQEKPKPEASPSDPASKTEPAPAAKTDAPKTEPAAEAAPAGDTGSDMKAQIQANVAKRAEEAGAKEAAADPGSDMKAQIQANVAKRAAEAPEPAAPPQEKSAAVPPATAPRKAAETTLLIIDPQCDFHGGGTLAVPGADEDAARTAAFIESNMASIARIVITLDTHHKLHIAHGAFWSSTAGESPPPFTLVSKQDVQAGVWVPRDSTLVDYVLDYIDKLEASGKFKLCIWPEHCIIGSRGHAVTAPILKAANNWSVMHSKNIQYVHKGQNNLTEMYSALSAEVPLDDDPATQYNSALQQSLLPASDEQQLLVCGQAMSHCVNYTVRDIVKNQPKEVTARLQLLTDCASSVTGFEAAGDEFVADMRTAGVKMVSAANLVLT